VPPTNNVRSLVDVTKKKITNPHAVAAYNVERSADDGFPGDPVQIYAQAINSKHAPVAEAGRVVTFVIVAGTGGSLSSATATTNSQGIATVTLTLGATVGSVFRVKATDTETRTGTSPNITVVADPEQPPSTRSRRRHRSGSPAAARHQSAATVRDGRVAPRVSSRRRSRVRPRPGRRVTVANGGDLQAALDAALPGDTILLRSADTRPGMGIGPQDRRHRRRLDHREKQRHDPGEGTRITPTVSANAP
jgi:hypothetical protein